MKGLTESRYGLPALVLVAVAALYGVAGATRPGAEAPKPAQPVRVAVESVSTVCPDPGGSQVSAITPPGGGQGPGVATVAEIQTPKQAAKQAKQAAESPAERKPLATLEQAGTLWQRDVSARSGPLLVEGTGSMAAGFEAAQTTRKLSGTERGLAGVRCVEPGANAWFVGPGPAAADVTLYLTNTDVATADVGIMIYSGEGPVLSDRGNGMVLKPGEHRTVKLRDLAPSPLVMAVEISTGHGRVGAAMKAALGAGKGVDWLPVAAEPATRVIVPGIPSAAGLRELYVSAPGENDTVVHVLAVRKDGAYALENRESVEVLAGSTATMDLSTGLSGQPAALVLTSDEPIVAGMKITGTGARQDVAFTAATPPIEFGSVVADDRAGRKQTSRLVLSAPGAAAGVKVLLLPKKGPVPEPLIVRLPAARTREIKLSPPPGGKAGFSLVITPEPGSGPVYGGRVLDERTSQGLLITTQPLAPARTWAVVRPTTDSPGAVLP